MDKIYSEKELLPVGTSWGEWDFSLSNEKINEKIASFPKNSNVLTENAIHWKNLFSLLPTDKLPKSLIVENSKSDASVMCLDEDSEMECSPVVFEDTEPKDGGINSSSVEDLTICLVDTCNQVASKLKPGLNFVQEEISALVNDLSTLNEGSVRLLMEKAWSQLHSDASRMCFCITFSSDIKLCKKLCGLVLFPWMKNGLPHKLELFSEVFSKQGDVFCSHLVAPLLQVEDSPLVKDLFTLEEIMTSMDKRHWTILLVELLSGYQNLQNWSCAILVTVVEHSEPKFEDVSMLVKLMSSAGSSFAQSRDFGSLLVAVAKCVKSGFGPVVPQLKLVANNYKGPLKFKALKKLAEIADS